VLPHLWRANNGETQLGAPGLQKGELLELLPVLPLERHQLSRTVSRRVRQATELPLGHLLGLACLCKPTLE
jgi:hypothetical protein